MIEMKDKDVREFMDEIVDDLGYTPKKEKTAFSQKLTAWNGKTRSLLFAGTGILLLVLILLHFSAVSGKLSKDDLAPVQRELQELKERIIALESVERRLFLLEKRTDKSFETAASGARKSEGQKENRAGKAVYHTISKGDTLSDIGKRYGLSVEELCRLNGITSKQTLRIGQKLLVKK